MAIFKPPTGHEYWKSASKRVIDAILLDQAEWRILHDKLSGFIPKDRKKNDLKPEWRLTAEGGWICELGGKQEPLIHDYRQLPGMPGTTYLMYSDKPKEFHPTSCIRSRVAYAVTGVLRASDAVDMRLWTKISETEYMRALDEPWMHVKPEPELKHHAAETQAVDPTSEPASMVSGTDPWGVPDIPVPALTPPDPELTLF